MSTDDDPNVDHGDDHDSFGDHEELPNVTLYVLGALAGAERDRVRRHIGVCRICTDELTRVAGLPGLLDRVNPGAPGEAPFAGPGARAGAGSSGEVQPPDEVYDQLIGRVRTQRARKRRWLVVGALAAAVVVIAIPTMTFAARPTSPAAALAAGPAPPIAQQADFHPMPLTTGDLGPATATAAVQAQPWGSSITVQAVNWKPGMNVRIDVITLDGERVEVGGWRSIGPGTTVCAATTWYPKDRLVQVQAVQDGGPELAALSL